MFVNFDEFLDKLLQFLLHEVYEKLIHFLVIFFNRIYLGLVDLFWHIFNRKYFCKAKKSKENDLEILNQSCNFLIINKLHDTLLNSNDKSKNSTVSSKLKKNFPDLLVDYQDFFFANRLDFATSGILLVPLNRKSITEVWDNFEQQKYSKFYYLALVRGHVENEYEIIDNMIGEDTRYLTTSKKMCTSREKVHCKNARRSTTKFLVLEKGFYNNKPVTKILLLPMTPIRRHQLRIHCLEIGNPIVGDYTYLSSLKSDIRPPRMFLHAFRLVYIHYSPINFINFHIIL